MWIPLRARWDQEPAGSLVVPTPQKIAGSVAGEREGKGGEEKGGKIGLRSLFFFLKKMYLHPTKILRNSPEAGMAPHTQVNGWDGRSRSSTCLVYESPDLGLYRKFRERIGAKIFSVTLES